MTIVRGTVVTMNPRREIIDDGAVVISDETIAAVGSFAEIRAAHPDETVSGRTQRPDTAGLCQRPSTSDR